MSIRARRGTRAQVTAAAAGGFLRESELIYLTDGAKFGFAKSISTFEVIERATANGIRFGTETGFVDVAGLRSGYARQPRALAANTTLSGNVHRERITASSAVTIINFASPGTLGNGWETIVTNAGTSNVTMNRTTGLIDGGTSITLKSGDTRWFFSDGTDISSILLVDGTVYATAAQGVKADTALQNAAAFATAAQGVLAANALAASAVATVAEVRAGTAGSKYISPAVINAAMEYVTFTAASINLDAFINGKITIAANTTFAAPTNAAEGKTGVLAITNNGSFTGSWNAFWDFGEAGPPTLSVGAGKVSLVSYAVLPGAASARCAFLGAA